MKKHLAWWVATLGLGLFPFPGLAQLDTNSPDGLITCRVWQCVNGYYVSDLLALPRFPNQPDFTLYPVELEYYPDANILFGVQMAGFVWPPVSGEYVFYLDCSGQAQLYLSLDDNPTNKVQIAKEPGGAGARGMGQHTAMGSPRRPSGQYLLSRFPPSGSEVLS